MSDIARLREFTRLLRVRADHGSDQNPCYIIGVGGEAGGEGELHLDDLEALFTGLKDLAERLRSYRGNDFELAAEEIEELIN